ncbi:VirC2 family conjugal transfer protein
MGIRKPAFSVAKTRRLVAGRYERATSEQADNPAGNKITSSQALPINNNVIFSSEPYEPVPKVQVFLSAAIPARGISASFDVLIGRYRRAKALQMILRRALDDYELMLSDGSFTKSTLIYSVEEPLVVVATSRMMPRHLVEIALSHFDPLGFESTRAFGRKLATSALAVFFDKEKRGTGRNS